MYEADLRDVNLRDAYVPENWFEEIEKQKVKGIEEIKEKYKIEQNEYGSSRLFKK